MRRAIPIPHTISSKTVPHLAQTSQPIKDPINLYKNINNIAIQMTPNEPFTYNLTDIPNCLKAVEEDRKMIIIRMDKIGQYPLQYIIGHIPDSTLYIHVGRGEGTLVCEKDKAIGHRVLKQNYTYRLDQHKIKGMEIKIRNNIPMNLAFDVTEPITSDTDQEMIELGTI